MKRDHIIIYAPATIANVGAGFDVLGIAIDEPGDVVYAERKFEPGLSFSLNSLAVNIPENDNNVAAYVAKLMLDELQPGLGVNITLYKRMPIGSGLGSSGASCAAAAMAVNMLLNKPLNKIDLVRFAAEGEKLASGSPHADNVAPSILGGVCLIRSYHPLDIIQLPVTHPFYWVVVHPHLEVATKTARELLPSMLPIGTAIEQWGNVGALVAGLILGDSHILAKSFNDQIAEPVRSPLIPGFAQAKQAALTAGAIGFSISGSGPSVFAVTASLDIAKLVATNIRQAFLKDANVKCDIYLSPINQYGAKILESLP
jgi:homoserine kinase